jgi:hypothetical protein
MGFRFQKRIKILPGIRLNLSKSGVSWTLGPRGASLGIGKRGTYGNLGIPGTGLSYRERIAGTSVDTPSDGPSGHLTPIPRSLALLAFVCFIVSPIALASGSLRWFVILLGIGIVLLVLRAKWIGEERQYVKDKTAEAEAQRKVQRKARIEYLMSRHSGDAELVARIEAGELWIGQTEDQLRDALGEPEDIDEKVMKTRRREIWKYDQVGTNRFSTKITLDDGEVVSWDKRD